MPSDGKRDGLEGRLEEGVVASQRFNRKHPFMSQIKKVNRRGHTVGTEKRDATLERGLCSSELPVEMRRLTHMGKEGGMAK